MECIGKGKARKPFEFGVKASLVITHKSGLIVGARSFPGNPYDAHTLAQQLERTNRLLQEIGTTPTTAVVDLGFKGVDVDMAPVQLIHCGKLKSLDTQQRRWLKRCQAIEPAIGHAKSDCRMDRCWLQSTAGDGLHTVLCAACFNIRWMLRAIARKGLVALLFALSQWALWVQRSGAAWIADATQAIQLTQFNWRWCQRWSRPCVEASWNLQGRRHHPILFAGGTSCASVTRTCRPCAATTWADC